MLFVPKTPSGRRRRRSNVSPHLAVGIAEPPPKGFQTVATLQDIPKVIPPVDLTQRPLDPRDFTGRGVEGGVADGVVGGTGRLSTSAEVLDAIYEATTSDARFEQATLVSEPAPRYPRALETVGIEGRVVLEFVVDTSGGSSRPRYGCCKAITPPSTTEARAAIAGAIFRPARFAATPFANSPANRSGS